MADELEVVTATDAVHTENVKVLREIAERLQVPYDDILRRCLADGIGQLLVTWTNATGEYGPHYAHAQAKTRMRFNVWQSTLPTKYPRVKLWPKGDEDAK